MSANIDIFKMKFSVFGHGFDDERSDSGDGLKIVEDVINYSASQAAIDETGQYIWLAGGQGIKKYDSADLTEIPTTITGSYLYHPNNVANNYGIAFQSGNVIVFDLTDDTIITQGSVTNYPMGRADCILDESVVRFVTLGQGRVSNSIYSLDLDDLTTTINSWNNESSCGFVAKDKIYSYYPPEWFTQNKSLYGRNLSAGLVWIQTATEAGSAGFPNISQAGFGNEYIWLPCYKYGKWRIGAFPWTGADFITPKPVKVFGAFNSQPDFVSANTLNVCQNTGRTRVGFSLADGTYRSDYRDVEKVTDVRKIPLAMDDNILLCAYSSKIYVYR